MARIELHDTEQGTVHIVMQSDPPMPTNLDDLTSPALQYAVAASKLFGMANDMGKHPADLIRFLKSRLKKLPKEPEKPKIQWERPWMGKLPKGTPHPKIILPGDEP